MKILKKIGLGLVIVIALFLVVVATRPGTFRYERTISIAAPADVVFAQLRDFHAWEKWSPWEKLDPSMKRTYGGSPAGKGATYAWVGNDKVGEGRMTIEDEKTNSSVTIKLEFLKPIAATNTTVLAITAEGSGTKLAWSMAGENNFGSKAAGLFMNLEKMIGDDFDRGLASIKAIAESAPKAVPPAAPTAAPAAAP